MEDEQGVEVDEGATNALFQGVGGVMENVRSMGVANTPQQPPFDSITHKIDPKTGETKTTVTGVTEATLKAFEENQRVAAQAKDIYGQIIQQAMAKKATLEAHPLVSAIGRITSQAATNYQLQGNGRPLVNAAGAFGAEYFRDTPESLLVRAAQAREKQFAITNQVQNQAEDIRRFDVQMGIAGMRNEQATKNNLIKTRGQYLELAEKGQITPEQAANIRADMKNNGASDQEADSFTGSVVAASQKAELLRQVAENAKTERQKAELKSERDLVFARIDSSERIADKRMAATIAAARVAADAKLKAEGGGLSPVMQRTVSAMAKGFDSQPIVKKVQAQAEAVSFAESLNPNSVNPADDQALIYAFAKAMDPDSVVREGEYATVQKYAQSWADRFGFNAKRTFSNTEFLTPKSRANMKATIKQRYEAGLKQYENVRGETARKINKTTGRADGEEWLTDYGAAFPGANERPGAGVDAPRPPQRPLPPEAVRALREGEITHFGNIGESWTLQNGRAVRVK